MATSISFLIFTFSLGFFCNAFAHDSKKVYIAYMGSLPENDYSPLDHHQSILQEVLEDSSPSETLIHSYKRSFNGFAANLTEKERRKLEGMKGIVSVFPSRTYQLLTTRSWDFVGLTNDVKRVPDIESDVIIGVLDSGIWPESESFNDKGIGPPPKKWNGVCNGGANFTCNNKIIGARFYASTDARDEVGHGSHTASTVAGRLVNNVSFYGLAEGTAKGAVPSARIAVYKVCGKGGEGCTGADILAGFDDAISDGVDLLSISIGGDLVHDYIEQPDAIGAFHALKKGILTSQAAGNFGPVLNSVSSVAPWIISVAASTIDRKIVTKLILGNNTTFEGNSVNGFSSTKKLPLVEAHGSLHKPFNQKVVFYDGFTRGLENASGMVVTDDELDGFSLVYPLPTVLVHIADGEKIKSYINSSSKPVASILKSENLNDASAPMVVSFSSRGPNPRDVHIVKPDIIAPGSSIIAAWSPLAAPSTSSDKRSVNYNIISGTSMACPHVTGAAAYVKTFHPDWSPSAIKSALMTTAYPLNATLNPDAELSYGSGHIDPVKAVDPGLVYDANEGDYINFLCNHYTEDQIRSLTGDKNTTCPKDKVLAKDLNYPSVGLSPKDRSFTRTVTNVGAANSKYTARITAPSDWMISVEPKVLSFKSINEKKSFVVKVSTKLTPDQKFTAASLVWSDGIHNVKIPIVVTNPLPGATVF